MAKIIKTEDGSNTLEHEVLGELYHSNRGALGEALHVFINNGLNCWLERNSQNNIETFIGHTASQQDSCDINIFEVGFGTGLNAWLTLKEASHNGLKIIYHSIEKYPLSEEVVRAVDHSKDEEFMELHRASWHEPYEINHNFTLHKYNADLTSFDFAPFKENFNVVYFDAFAPDSQPELWSSDIFAKIYAAMSTNGILTTYAAKGDIKRSLREVGFNLERITGALGKRHMLRATKKTPLPFLQEIQLYSRLNIL